MKRGQGAIEFTMLTAIMLLIFSVGIIAAEHRFIAIQEQQFEDQIFEILYELEEEFSIVGSAGIGFSRNITIPGTLGGLNYTIELHTTATPQKDALYLRVEDEEYQIFLQENVAGTLDPGRIHQLDGGDPITVTPQ